MVLVFVTARIHIQNLVLVPASALRWALSVRMVVVHPNTSSENTHSFSHSSPTNTVYAFVVSDDALRRRRKPWTTA